MIGIERTRGFYRLSPTLDVGPLLADAAGVIALDARVVVEPTGVVPLEIRPYLRELEATRTLPLQARTPPSTQ